MNFTEGTKMNWFHIPFLFCVVTSVIAEPYVYPYTYIYLIYFSRLIFKMLNIKYYATIFNFILLMFLKGIIA